MTWQVLNLFMFCGNQHTWLQLVQLEGYLVITSILPMFSDSCGILQILARKSRGCMVMRATLFSPKTKIKRVRPLIPQMQQSRPWRNRWWNWRKLLIYTSSCNLFLAEHYFVSDIAAGTIKLFLGLTDTVGTLRSNNADVTEADRK